MSVTPEEFTKAIVDKFARPADPEALMTWSPKPHAIRLLSQALGGVIGADHPLAKLIAAYVAADIVASKFSHIDSSDADRIETLSGEVDSAHDDLQDLMRLWIDEINAATRP